MIKIFYLYLYILLLTLKFNTNELVTNDNSTTQIKNWKEILIGVLLLSITSIFTIYLLFYNVILSFFQPVTSKKETKIIIFQQNNLLYTIPIETAKEIERNIKNNIKNSLLLNDNIKNLKLAVNKSLINLYTMYDRKFLKQTLELSNNIDSQNERLFYRLTDQQINDENIIKLLTFFNNHILEIHKKKANCNIIFLGLILYLKKHNSYNDFFKNDLQLTKEKNKFFNIFEGTSSVTFDKIPTEEKEIFKTNFYSDKEIERQKDIINKLEILDIEDKDTELQKTITKIFHKLSETNSLKFSPSIFYPIN